MAVSLRTKWRILRVLSVIGFGLSVIALPWLFPLFLLPIGLYLVLFYIAQKRLARGPGSIAAKERDREIEYLELWNDQWDPPEEGDFYYWNGGRFVENLKGIPV